MNFRENDLKMMEALVQHMNEQIHHLSQHCPTPMGQILLDELHSSVKKLSQLFGQTVSSLPLQRPAMDYAAASSSPAPISSAPPNVPSAFVASVPVAETTGLKKTLYLIDDDKDAQKVLGYMFERKSSFRVVSYTDPLQAWADIKANPPDLILMDLMMPGISGLDLLKNIRTIPNLNSVKILIGSSKSFDKDRIEVLKAGANDFIAKPYNFTELLLRLNKLTS
ncbi:MAG: response regulator [Proteobacteria bacterium]|nr:MAG: response regulator [Pseudomonadota bacterium]